MSEKFSSGWKPYECLGNECEFRPNFEEVSKQALHVEVIQDREIVFAGDDKAVEFLEKCGFTPVQNLDFNKEKKKDWE